MEAWLGIRLAAVAIAVALLVLSFLERLAARAWPRYARALALRPLRARRDFLGPTRREPSDGSYRVHAERPSFDIARLPERAALPGGGELHRYRGTASWLAYAGARREPTRREASMVWLELRRDGDVIRVEARAAYSSLRVLLPIACAYVVGTYTNANAIVAIATAPFVFFLGLLFALGRDADDERLAEAALVEIEDALAQMDDETRSEDAPVSEAVTAP